MGFPMGKAHRFSYGFFPGFFSGFFRPTSQGYLPFADELDDPTEVCTAVLKDPLESRGDGVGAIGRGATFQK